MLFTKKLSLLNFPLSFYSTLFFIIGILLENYNLSYSYNLFLLYLTTAPFFIHKQLIKSYIFLLFFFLIILLGGYRYKKQQTTFEDFHSCIGKKTFNIKAIVTNKENITVKNMRNLLTLNIKSLSLNEKENNTNLCLPGYIQIYTQEDTSIEVDDIIEIENLQSSFLQKKSFKKYLIKESILATIFIPSIKYKTIYRPRYSLNRILYFIKTKLLLTMQKKLSTPSFVFISSLFLGNKSINKNASTLLSSQFKKWGIAHLFARSGLHLTLFLLALSFSLRAIPLSFNIKRMFIFILALLYSLLSWPSISFQRAVYTFFFCFFLSLNKTHTHLLHAISIICFFTLLINPIQLFFLDFQLSFFLTASLVWVNQHLFK